MVFERQELKSLLRNKIRDARLAKHLTFDQLSNMTGIGAAHLQHIEGGQAGASIASLFTIASALELSLDAILFPDKDHPSDTEFRAVQLIRQSPESQQKAVVAMLEELNAPFEEESTQSGI